MRVISRFLPLIAFYLVATSVHAEAGVFSIPRYLEPGKNAVGIEPEVVLTNGGGVAGNLRYQHGVSELSNLHLLVGTGTEPRRFRGGGVMTFDFIPDIDRQPGMGIAVSAIYYRYVGFGQLDLAAIPYIHKTFYNPAGNSVQPFFALPIGPEFRSGNYNWAATAAFGALFHREGSRVSFIIESGVSLNRAETTISGGLLFTP